LVRRLREVGSQNHRKKTSNKQNPQSGNVPSAWERPALKGVSSEKNEGERQTPQGPVLGLRCRRVGQGRKGGKKKKIRASERGDAKRITGGGGKKKKYSKKGYKRGIDP